MEPTNADNRAVLLCRVSSGRQAEGYSLEFQEKLGREYAAHHGIRIIKVFTIIETASYREEREKWMEFVDYVEKGTVNIVLIAKIDRASRNIHDMSIIEDMVHKLGKTFHFFLDGITYSKDSPETVFEMFGIQGIHAASFSKGLSKRTKHGLHRKTANGEMSGRAPTGYINNILKHKVEKDPNMAPWVIRMFELAAKSLYSLRAISEKLLEEGAPKKFHISNIEHILRNPAYHGDFRAVGVIHKGTHEPLISRELHEAAIKGLERLNKSKYRSLKNVLLYNGVITCGTCNRAVFGEDKKKGKYRLYHCSGRFPCTKIIYVNETELTSGFTEIIKGIELEPDVIKFILRRLENETHSDMAKKTIELTTQRAQATRTESLIQNALELLCDPQTPNDLKPSLNAKLARWRADKERLGARIRALEETTPDRYMPSLRNLLELSKRAFSLYEKMEPEKKREFLKTICSNYILREKTLYPVYKKPFDLLVKGSSVQIGSGTRIRT